jgi:hypothetical protein
LVEEESSSDSDFSADENSPSLSKKQKHKHHKTKDESSELGSPLLYRQIDDKYLIPPPEDLIAKSVFIQEPIRTGGPFSFV